MTAARAMAHDASFVLEARNVVKDFPGARALDGVSFAVHPGEVHALVGENGAGKSTLIKVLSGVHPHGSFEGEVRVDGRAVKFRGIGDSERAGIGVIHQELALVDYMTAAENIFLGDEPVRFGLVDFEKMYARSMELLGSLGVEVDAGSMVGELGVSLKQMVEIAKAVRKKSRVLVLDEPTAALASREVKALLDLIASLRDQGAAIVYISHKLEEVFAVADRITVLRDGKSVASRRASDWTRQEVIGAMVGREVSEVFPRVDRSPGPVALEVEDLSIEAPGRPGVYILDKVSFSVREGRILGVAGLMGSGRTSLLSALFGSPPGKRTGRIKVRGVEVQIDSPSQAIAAGLALAPEDRKLHGLIRSFSVKDNLSMVHLDDFVRFGLVDSAREREACREAAAAMGVKAPSLEAAVETLSGGNQQKVVLGKWLLRAPRVLLLDEPTRGIDVGAKAEVHENIGRLAAKGMAVIMASSELPEVLGVSDEILVLREGKVAARLDRGEAAAEKIMEAAT